MAQNAPKWSKMVQKSWKRSKTAFNNPKRLEMKRSETVQNGPKWSEIVWNGLKQLKTPQNSPKSPKTI
jgi:hypothetical protein